MVEVFYPPLSNFFFSGPTPVTVTFFQCLGNTEGTCTIPSSVFFNRSNTRHIHHFTKFGQNRRNLYKTLIRNL